MLFRSYSSYLKERFGEKTHRISLDAGFGCPHRNQGRGAGGCVFCNPHGSGNQAFDQGLAIKEQMEQGVQKLTRNKVKKYIAYFQAFSCTGGGLMRLRALYKEAVSFEGVVGLSIGTRPDMVPDKVLELLREFARGEGGGPPLEVWLEMGLQSSHEQTLNLINRGHDRACFDDAVKRANEMGLLVAAHIILGLPGEGKKEMMATAEHIASLPVQGLKLHHLFVEKGTALAQMHKKQPLSLLTLEAYMDLVVSVLRIQKKECVIMRMAGWAKPEDLIAPQWGVRPSVVVQKIEKLMGIKGVQQGDLYKA